MSAQQKLALDSYYRTQLYLNRFITSCSNFKILPGVKYYSEGKEMVDGGKVPKHNSI